MNTIYVMILTFTLSHGPVNMYMPFDNELECRTVVSEFQKAYPALVEPAKEKECSIYRPGDDPPTPDPRT